MLYYHRVLGKESRPMSNRKGQVKVGNFNELEL